MSNGAKLAALNKFKSPTPGMMRQVPMRLLIVYDVIVKTPDVPQVPLIINYGKRYLVNRGLLTLTSCQICQRLSKNMPIGKFAYPRCRMFLTFYLSVAPAIAPNYSRAGVVINFVTATGGDVEMLRSIECFYK